jgi:hypothetical protein
VQLAFLDDDIEREQVLTVVDLPTGRSIAHDYPLADRADAQSRKRRVLGQMLAEFVERAPYSTTRNVGLCQRPRGAQHDQVLEGEPVLTPRTARRCYETAVDESLDFASRQAEDPLDVLHAV